MAHNFKELNVWNDSMLLTKTVYSRTQIFPPEERFGLTAQMRRCAVSIPSNIAEGAGRSSNKEFVRFLDIAIASAYELETQVLLSIDFEYIKENALEIINLINSVQKMLIGLKKTIVV
ncbi:MAG: four helix bundle protein [Chitinophagaceae bacterium]|jgi:four helix bundle protein